MKMWRGKVVKLGGNNRVVSRQKLMPGVKEFVAPKVRYRIL